MVVEASSIFSPTIQGKMRQRSQLDPVVHDSQAGNSLGFLADWAARMGSCDCSRSSDREALGDIHSCSFTEVVKGTSLDGSLLKYLLSTVGLPKAWLVVSPGD